MPHVLEEASSGRAKCRGCGRPIARGELRFGEKLPNPFADGEMTHWYHPPCAAYKRPEPLLETLAAAPETPGRDSLEAIARAGLAHPRLQRIDGAERSPGSQARCRQCKELIGKGDWRIRLQFHQDGRFEPGGFIHVACRDAYFEAAAALEHVLQFGRDLTSDERAALQAAWAAPQKVSPPGVA